jgi:xanthine dehydrogenase large subunit
MSPDLSGPINDRAMFHADNCLLSAEHVTIVSHRCKTHTVSNTAFRGFGGPQGMMGSSGDGRDRARICSTRSTCASAISTARPTATSRPTT